MNRIQRDKQINRQLLTIVIPIAFQYLMSSMVGASDALMMGLLNQDSLAAVALATQIAFVYSLFHGAFIYGVNVMAAQYWGKKDLCSVEQILAIAMRYTLLVGMVFTVGAFLFPQGIMRIFTNDVNLIRIGASYLKVVAVSYVLGGFSQIYFGIMKICDRATLSSIIGSISVVLNIVFNAIFIFGLVGMPKMGVEGAAFATVLARLFEVVCVIVILIRRRCVVLRLRYLFRLKEKVLHKDYWHYTIPLFMNQMGWGGGITMYSVILGHLGTDITSANSISAIVRCAIASACWGLASGVGIILGGMLGRGELEEAKRVGGRFVRLSIKVGAVSGLVILAISPLVIHFVTLGDVANGYLKVLLCYTAYYVIGNSLNSTIISGIFPAGGDTKFGMICDIVTLWAFVVPFAALAAFVFHWPVLVVSFILTLDEFVKIPAVYFHYKKYRWCRNITRDNLVKEPATGTSE